MLPYGLIIAMTLYVLTRWFLFHRSKNQTPPVERMDQEILELLNREKENR